MTTMQAKFAGCCETCGDRFPAGAQIEWSRASGARHVSCGGAAAALAARIRALEVRS